MGAASAAAGSGPVVWIFWLSRTRRGGHPLLRSPNDIGVFVQHAFGLCVNVPYGRVPVHEALRSEYPQCPVCVTLWSQNVPPIRAPNWSEAPLLANQFSERSEGVYFVILDLYNGFKWSKLNVSKICTFLLHEIRAVEFISSYSFLQMKI